MSEAAAPVVSYQPVRVLDAWDETHALRALRIELGPSLTALHTAPGQVLRVRVAGRNDWFLALASRPQNGVAELLIKRGSEDAEAVLQSAAQGQIEVSALFGNGFPVDKLRGRHVLMFAAGSGIAPMRALVQHIIGMRKEVGRVALYYGQRWETDFAYGREHDAWERAGVRVFLCSSQPSGGWPGRAGHVQDVARANRLDDIGGPSAIAYLCGMKGMVSSVKELLVEAGVSAERTFLNY